MFRKNPPAAEVSGEVANQNGDSSGQSITREAMANLSLEAIANEIEAFDLSRLVGSSGENPSAYKTILRQVTEFVDLEDPENLRVNCRSVVDKYLKEGFYETLGRDLAERELLTAERIVRETICVRQIVDIDRSKLGRLMENTRDDPNERFKLLKAVGSLDSEESLRNRGILWTFALNRIEGHEDDELIGRTQAELESGDFDSLVAGDLISEAHNPNTTSQRAAKLEPITRFVRFLEGVLGDGIGDKEFNERLFSKEVMQLWPKDVVHLVEMRRKEILAISEEKITKYQNDLKTKGLIRLPKDEKHLLGNTKAYFEQTRRSIDALGITKILKRKRMTSVEPDQSEEISSPEIVDEPIENSVKTYSQDRELVDMSQENIIDMAGQGGFDVKDRNLSDDISRIFEYLVTIDRAFPADSGLKKLGKEYKGKDDGRDLWEFKPSMANGLPTSTKQTNYIRVILSMCDEGFVVLGIVNRNALDKGIRSIVSSLKNRQ